MGYGSRPFNSAQEFIETGRQLAAGFPRMGAEPHQLRDQSRPAQIAASNRAGRTSPPSNNPSRLSDK